MRESGLTEAKQVNFLMKTKYYHTINISGRLLDLDVAKVMGVLNVTPDSFHDGCRSFDEYKIERRVAEIVEEGADIIDIGGCSTRPGSQPVSYEEEWERICRALKCIKKINPQIIISVDTWRSEIAKRCVEDYGVNIINDISGGNLDPEMFNVIAELKVPYVLTHMRGNPEIMTKLADYNDVTADVITDLSKKVNELRRKGVNDIIIDPGFGFAKTLEQNFKLLSELDEICRMGIPVMVGISRKSMIYKTLGTTPENSLTGTIVLNSIALEKGASILRVHDVSEAIETVKLINELKKTVN